MVGGPGPQQFLGSERQVQGGAGGEAAAGDAPEQGFLSGQRDAGAACGQGDAWALHEDSFGGFWFGLYGPSSAAGMTAIPSGRR